MPVIHVRSEAEYETVLKKAGDVKLVVVDFTATWCGPCQRIAPLYEALSDKYRQSVFLKVDVDECQEVAASNDVKAMPTFVFVRGGKELDRIRGADPQALEDKIKKFAGPAGGAAAFTGDGNRLGGACGDSGEAAAAAVDPSSLKDLEEKAQAALGVDESKPNTKVSVRMADGSKFTVKLNLSHPVSKIREFICNARSDQASKIFVLMTTFPSQEISDESASIEDAKLANAVVVQKMK